MKIRKNGFTLVELIAVIALLALVMLLIVPGLGNLSETNQEKEYKTYEDMMIEYAKAMPNTKFKSDGNGKYVCLKDLDLESINSNDVCNGYVRITGNTYKSFLSCTNNGTSKYKSDGYILPSGC